MKNKLLPAGLFLPLICFLMSIGVVEFQRSLSYEVLVPATGYDPRDLISGHFLRLQVDEKNIDCTQFSSGECPQAGYFEANYKYFVPEDDAYRLEKLIRKPQTKTELVFKIYKNHKPKLEKLLINDEEWQKAEK